jgi:hypothetical protein
MLKNPQSHLEEASITAIPTMNTLSLPLFHIMNLNKHSRYRLNTPLFITEKDAGGLIYATYEYGSLGFSGLTKRARCGIAGDTRDTPPLLTPYGAPNSAALSPPWPNHTPP